MADANHLPLKSAAKKAGIFSFVFVMFSYTTGGPFGLEEMVTTSGPGMALLYQLFIPFFWCIPISLVAAELTTAMPVQGGFYRWVRAGYGDFWGFLAGWWNWSASFLLGSAYAVLFADYGSSFFPSITRAEHFAICAALIAIVTYINVRGITLVGKISTVLEIAVLLPIAAMTAIALAHAHHNPFVPLTPPHKPFSQVFGVGLALGVWLYSGYEQLSTVAEEVDNPRRNYPRALAIVVPMSIATYFLPTFASLAALNNWQDWGTGYFAEAARLIGGASLAATVTLAAAVANVCLLNSTVLATTRMPFALAEDGFLPKRLTRLHPRFGTPALCIVISGIVYALLAIHSLAQLITIYAWLRVATTLMTALSGWRLRKTHPTLERSFTIPGGKAGLFYSVAAPVSMGVVAIAGSLLSADKFALFWGPAVILLGPITYFVLRPKKHARETAQVS
ncbi:MAG: APC family permease [Acidobacteria bacterium]|nr:APC family permease [Acidobacteriota bacterium]MBS1867067.1 APC family permease [Acidobacteriota bacterium]